jgi:hypothetical protein
VSPDERERIGVAAMQAMVCTHDGDDFGPRAVCQTCWDNVQRVCRAVLAVLDAAEDRP